ncbi:MAG: ABC transporter permease [Firmicutes bacterium]|nr:ABC transporter permease [Bacillota bacterium]
MSRTVAINYIIAMVFILTLNFILPRLMPGDPLQAIYGEEAMLAMTEELKATLVSRFALDQSPGEQFAAYCLALARGDLGHSYYYNAPVLEILLGFLPWTALLAGLALVISTGLGVILGIESGYRRGRPLDGFMLSGLIFFNGLPDFFLGALLLLLFGVTLQMAPLAGAMTPYAGYTGLALVLDVLRHLALPLTALVLARLTATYLLTRNTMITTLGEAFIVTARAKGCPEYSIRYRHAGRNALLPVITNTGLQFTRLFTGALFIEIIFAYPGLGTLLYNALLTRDYPLLQGILLMVALVVLTINYLVDRLYPKIDPRVSHAH